MIRRGRLWCFVLLLALAGPVAPAYAAEGAWPGLGGVWPWLESWLLWVVETGDQCGGIDPDGRCRDGNTTATGDQCGMIDPDGRCRDGNAAESLDQCAGIDPDGRCRDGDSATSGPWIDPND
jgi:hypothetical protein